MSNVSARSRLDFDTFGLCLIKVHPHNSTGVRAVDRYWFPTRSDRLALLSVEMSGLDHTTNFSGRRDYVVLENGELIVGKRGHLDLSQGADVLPAGEARFVSGKLKSLDNASGHYKPSGISARNAAETAFQNAGFEALGKYGEKSF